MTEDTSNSDTETLLANISNRSITVATREKKCCMTFSVHRKAGLVSSRLGLSISHQSVCQRKEFSETTITTQIQQTEQTRLRFPYI